MAVASIYSRADSQCCGERSNFTDGAVDHGGELLRLGQRDFLMCQSMRCSHILQRRPFKHLRPTNSAEWKIFRPRRSHIPCRRFRCRHARDHPCWVITPDKRRPQIFLKKRQSEIARQPCVYTGIEKRLQQAARDIACTLHYIHSTLECSQYLAK